MPDRTLHPAPSYLFDLDEDTARITSDNFGTAELPEYMKAAAQILSQSARAPQPGDYLPPGERDEGPAPSSLSSSSGSGYREIVVDANGVPRMAGADASGREGEFIKRFRELAERNLYIFAKGVLGRHFLTPHLHKPVCEFLQACPPARKLVLMPREHAKTAIVSGALPPHIHIQPAAHNIYFPGMEGSECRILLSGETETMAKKNLRVVKAVYEENQLLRALWPHRVWESATKQAKEWSSNAIILPRQNEWPDPSVRAVGVGGAITGARPNVLIKDDLVSFAAANSEIVMQEAIDWHIASRALLETYELEAGRQSLEFIIGTRWAVYDLYSYIIENDPTVEVIDPHFWRIIDDGRILWPEKYTEKSIEQLKHEHKAMFWLLFMNTAADASLTDFDLSQVRRFKLLEGKVLFDPDERDEFMLQKRDAVRAVDGAAHNQPAPDLRGMRMAQAMDFMARRGEVLKGMRFRQA